jgi:RNA recognition motif-containing protein
VSLGPDNRSRGYGTVLLATAEDAGRAIDMYNGYSWQTRVLEVRPDRLPPDTDGSSSHQGSAVGTPAGQYASSLASPLSQSSFHDELLPRPTSVAGGNRTLFVGNVSSVVGRSLFRCLTCRI